LPEILAGFATGWQRLSCPSQAGDKALAILSMHGGICFAAE
jgi:hypothetical protein